MQSIEMPIRIRGSGGGCLTPRAAGCSRSATRCTSAATTALSGRSAVSNACSVACSATSKSTRPTARVGVRGAGRSSLPATLCASTRVRKRVFLSHFYIKTIILPRQARDKHRESSKKDAFRFCRRDTHLCGGGATGERRISVRYGRRTPCCPTGQRPWPRLHLGPAGIHRGWRYSK